MKRYLRQITDQFNRQVVIVIGDMVADVYLEGKISRISREAPVLVLDFQGETIVPGGAANVVHNAATLGSKVHAFGVIGSDPAGNELKRILKEKGVITDGLLEAAQRPTITKTRVMAGGAATVRQQVVRIDREIKEPLAPELEEQLLERFAIILPSAGAVILSDYGVGTLSERIRQTVLYACKLKGVPCLVDSRYDILNFTGATVVKQNEAEITAVMGCKDMTEASLIQAGQEMLEKMKAEAIMLTRGPEGMTIVENDKITHIPVSTVTEVIDVSGAGDTAVITMALALAAGADYPSAARLANYAAGVVVRKFGTATTTQRELKEAIGE